MKHARQGALRSCAALALILMFAAAQWIALHHGAEHAFAAHEHAGSDCVLDGLLDRSAGAGLAEPPRLIQPLLIGLVEQIFSQPAAIAAEAISPSARGPPLLSRTA